MEVSVPYTGFVPGQSVPMVIKLNNNSKIAVDGIRVLLEKVIFLNVSNVFIFLIHQIFRRFI